MADTFTDNQEVTATDLNNIAIDLGYADYDHFPETPPQSAVSALNQITKDLTSKGVLQALNKCEITASGGNIIVATGIIVFDTGAKKRIETAVTLTSQNGTSYVYALNNTNDNTITLNCDTAFPTSGDYVKLATVTDNVVTDMREWSKSTVVTDAPHTTETVHVSITDGELEAVAAGELVKSYQLKSASYSVLSYYTNQYLLAVFDINTGVYGMKASATSDEERSGKASPGAFTLLTYYSNHVREYIKVKIEGNRLNFYRNGSDNSGITADFIFH